jgi:Flp pilus assembly protein TadD
MGLFDFLKKSDDKIDAFDYADKLFNQGKYLDAIRLMDLAIETNPTNWYSLHL